MSRPHVGVAFTKRGLTVRLAVSVGGIRLAIPVKVNLGK